MDIMDIMEIIEIESIVFCTENLDLLFKPCVDAMLECLQNDGLNALEWCQENIMEFYDGI